MYKMIDAKRSTRTLYTEALVGRGDITPEEADGIANDYQAQLESIFAAVNNIEPEHDANFKAPVAPEPELKAKIDGKGGEVALAFYSKGQHHASYCLGWEYALQLGVSLVEQATKARGA
jgi:2-oxoglutarate dehydrogenase complex dehydrogenase (E1) component-like enzyme